MRIYYCCLFLILLIPTTTQIEPTQVITIIGTVWKLAEWITDIWKSSEGGDIGGLLNYTGNIGDVGLNLNLSVNLNIGSVMRKFEHISNQINEIEQKIRGVEKTLRRLETELPAIVRYELRWSKLYENIRHIESLYKLLLKYQEHRKDIEEFTLRDFATQIVSHDTYSPKNTLWHIHDMVSPEIREKKGIFQNLANVLKVS